MTLFLAALVLVAFVAIPRRLWYFQLPAVLGWVVAWIDNDLPGHWWDWLGLCVVTASLAGLARHYAVAHARGQVRIEPG